MKNCEQTAGQNIFDHGLSVWSQLQKITSGNTSEIQEPQWFTRYKDQIISSIHSADILEQYAVYHDAGKPYCLEVDQDGKRHFPNHAAISKQTYQSCFGIDGEHASIAELIGLDMIFHTDTADNIIAMNLSTATLCTLMLTALAEIHSNANSFYPDEVLDSTWFKIKFKRLEKLGNRICKHLFEHQYVYAVTRKDLPIPQQAVQCGHAAIESARDFLKANDEHPSLIICTVKGESQLHRAANETEACGIRIKRFYERDRSNELTAFATEPLIGEARKPMRKFQLMK